MDCPHDRIEVTRNTKAGAFDDHEQVEGYCRDCKALVAGVIYFNGNVDVHTVKPAREWRVAS